MNNLYVEPLFQSHAFVEKETLSENFTQAHTEKINEKVSSNTHFTALIEALPIKNEKLTPTLERLKKALDEKNQKLAIELLDLLENLLDLDLI